MTTYYCNSCSQKLGYIHSINPTTDFTGSVGGYMHDKFLKHTQIPISTSTVISVFDTADYDTYKDFILDAASSGSVEVDDQNRVNIIWIAHQQTGMTFEPAQSPQPVNAVKLVLYQDLQKIHAYPTGSSGLLSIQCSCCGNLIAV